MATKITPKFRNDKIVSLSHSAGNISIQSGSILTIGGLQYEIDVQKSVALPTMTANTRYQVFAVISGGDVVLVISQNENSVGPVGYTSWKLVGSLMANSALTFAGFIDIKTSPSFAAYSAGPLVITATGSNPIQSGNTKIIDRLMVSRRGSKALYSIEFSQTAAGSNTAGTGDYLFNLPFNANLDTTTVFTTVAGQNVAYSPTNHLGSGSLRVGTTQVTVGVYLYDQNKVRLGGINVVQNFTGGGLAWAAGGTQVALNQATISYAATFEMDIQGWSNTPIEDL